MKNYILAAVLLSSVNGFASSEAQSVCDQKPTSVEARTTCVLSLWSGLPASQITESDRLSELWSVNHKDDFFIPFDLGAEPVGVQEPQGQGVVTLLNALTQEFNGTGSGHITAKCLKGGDLNPSIIPSVGSLANAIGECI